VATATHGSTIGGGRIIRVLAPRARKGSHHAAAVATLAGARQDQRIALDIKAAAFAGLGIADLVHRLGVPADALASGLATLVASGDLLVTGSADHAHYLLATAVADLEARIVTAVASSPDGAAREQLRTQLPAALPARAYDAIVGGLERKATIVLDGDWLRRASGPPRAAPSPVETRLAEQFRTWGLEPPRPKDVAAAVGLTDALIRPLLDRLLAARRLVKIKPDLYVHADALAELRARLLAFLEAHKTIDAQQWKELTGASRKFTIPLAEYFDRVRVTLRVGDKRVARKER